MLTAEQMEWEFPEASEPEEPPAEAEPPSAPAPSRAPAAAGPPKPPAPPPARAPRPTTAPGRGAPPTRWKAPPPAADHKPADRWTYLIEKAIKNHRAAFRAIAAKWAKNMPKHIDTRKPTGITIQGQRWGWREIRSAW